MSNQILFWVAFLPVYILNIILSLRLGLTCTLEFFEVFKPKLYIILYILLCPLIWGIPLTLMGFGIYCITQGYDLGNMISNSGYPDMFNLNLDFFTK